jgi:opacity protein-like surface antigen
MKPFVSALFVVALAAPAAAQPAPPLSFRPFVMISEQRFAAEETFKAVFGQSNQVFWGGGLNVTQDDQFYLELSASRFEKTGQRAFRNNGQSFGLGIPLTATLTPFEVTAGYRFHRQPSSRSRIARPSRFIPYLGGGVGLYQYKETSDFANDDENVDTRHAGLIVEGGIEVRLHRWFGLAGDVRFTHVPGILGAGGISQDAGESDLGGIAGRIKLVVGR